MFENINLFVVLAGLFLSIFGAIWSLAWWLSGKFSEIRNLVYSTAEKTLEKILNKLEYHERHDDERFSRIHEDMAEVRIRNASKDALMATIASKLEKLNA